MDIDTGLCLIYVTNMLVKELNGPIYDYFLRYIVLPLNISLGTSELVKVQVMTAALVIENPRYY